MKTWAIVNKKGGCSKTTLATQLAVYANQIGLRTLLLDIDPQGSASVWHDERGRESTPTVYPTIPDDVIKVIKGAQQTEGLIDLIIIDTAPHADKGVIAAIKFADLIICPTTPGLLDRAATGDTLSLIERGGFIDRAIGVACRISTAGTVKAYADATASLEARNIRVAASYMCERAAYRDAINRGKGVGEMRPPDRKAVIEIQSIFQELMDTWPVPTVVAGVAND